MHSPGAVRAVINVPLMLRLKTASSLNLAAHNPSEMCPSNDRNWSPKQVLKRCPQGVSGTSGLEGTGNSGGVVVCQTIERDTGRLHVCMHWEAHRVYGRCRLSPLKGIELRTMGETEGRMGKSVALGPTGGVLASVVRRKCQAEKQSGRSWCSASSVI